VQIPSHQTLYGDVLQEKLHQPPPAGWSDSLAKSLCTVLQIPFPDRNRAAAAGGAVVPGPDSWKPPSPEENAAFLRGNLKQPGVVGTELGLQWKILKRGEGRSPTPDSTVRVHYTGRLINGSIFDTTRQADEPAEFRLDSVIPGWRRGLLSMREGGRRILYIPARLGYEDRPQGAIPPHSTLIFDVELLQVKE